MSGQRRHESGAKKRKLQATKKERATELLQKTPTLTNLWSRPSQPAVAATTTSEDAVSDEQQPTTASTSQLTSPTSQSASTATIAGESDFPDELEQFVHFAKVSTENRQPMNLLSFIRERNLQHVFPNVDIALRIYLTLPVSNASGERSFSKLAIIKHKLRTTMLEEKLNNLTLMSIEHDMLAKMDFEELINDFAGKKSRKRAF